MNPLAQVLDKAQDATTLQIAGAMGFGLLVGWYVYYINRYRRGDIQWSDLVTLIGIIGGTSHPVFIPPGHRSVRGVRHRPGCGLLLLFHCPADYGAHLQKTSALTGSWMGGASFPIRKNTCLKSRRTSAAWAWLPAATKPTCRPRCRRA